MPMLHKTAVSNDWPHALSREIARRTLLELPASMITSMDIDLNEITFANIPTSCRVDRRGSMLHRQRSKDVQFQFDSTDTIPYWFDPLAHVFGINTREIETHADRWITTILGYDNETVRADRERFWSRFDYGDISNNHGAQPRVEDLQTYLEWHAMFLSAGQLIDSGEPSIVDDYEMPYDRWSEWLSRYLNLERGTWAADHRDPVPTWSRLHARDQPRRTWRLLSDADFDREVLIDGEIIVSASTKRSDGNLYESTSVNSALVSPESAEALLTCLQDLPDHRYYAFPTDHEDSRHKIDEPGFQLVGWLTDTRGDDDGLDEHDPVGRITQEICVPSLEFQRTVVNSYSVQEWQTSSHALCGPSKVAQMERQANQPLHILSTSLYRRSTDTRSDVGTCPLPHECWQGSDS